MTEIPSPSDSGSSGTQESNDDVNGIVPAQKPFDGLMPIDVMVSGLAETNSRSLGGEVAAGLLAASVTQMSNELLDTKHQLKDCRVELKDAQAQLHDWKEKALILQERVKGSQTIRNLGNVAITFGVTMVAAGVDMYDKTGWGYAIGVLGVGLVAIGWFAGQGGRNK